MDADRELASARRRVQAKIDRDARAALIRLGIDVEAEDRARQARLMREVAEPFRAYGRALGALQNALINASKAFNEGFREAAHRER